MIPVLPAERQQSIPDGVVLPPVQLDPVMVAQVFELTRSVQWRYDHTQKPQKLAAKQRAADLINKRLPEGGRLLDVGGEEFYHQALGTFDITVHNLPEHDMHAMAYSEEFDAVLAMHVLEHSPFPMLVLKLIHHALKPDGFLYVAVPKPCDKFCTSFGHWTVMSAPMWRTCLEGVGFKVLGHETGKFGPKAVWWEERFLCQR